MTGSARTVTPLRAVVLALVGLALVAAVTLALLSSTGSDAGRASEDPVTQRVSEEAYDAVRLSTPKEDVLAALRPAQPVDARTLDRYEDRSPETVASECVYFDSEGIRAGALYRFCFDQDRLVDKTVVLPAEDR